MQQQNGYTYKELIRQPYLNMVVSAGSVAGHAVDTVYLKLERNGVEDLLLLMRRDEAVAIAWCLLGTLWSHELADYHGSRPLVDSHE